jgi:hypothetical protein
MTAAWGMVRQSGRQFVEKIMPFEDDGRMTRKVAGVFG